MDLRPTASNRNVGFKTEKKLRRKELEEVACDGAECRVMQAPSVRGQQTCVAH